MEGRTIEAILEEWRAAERELEAAVGDAGAAILARIDKLREEHRMAIADRDVIARDLGQLVSRGGSTSDTLESSTRCRRPSCWNTPRPIGGSAHIAAADASRRIGTLRLSLTPRGCRRVPPRDAPHGPTVGALQPGQRGACSSAAIQSQPACQCAPSLRSPSARRLEGPRHQARDRPSRAASPSGSGGCGRPARRASKMRSGSVRRPTGMCDLRATRQYG